MENKPRLLRITTVPISLKLLLKGQLTFFKNHGFEVLAVSSPEKEAQSIIDEGIRFEAVKMTRKITPLQDLAALFKLIFLIRQFRPHILHSHTPKAGLLGMMAAWICRVPVRLHTVAGLPLMEATGIKRKLLVLTERMTYFFASNIYSNSAGLRSYIHNTLRINKAMDIIGHGSSNGININYFARTPALELAGYEIRRKYSVSENDVVFSFVGRIVRDKGIVELIEAFRNISNMNASIRFKLIIVGPFEEELDPISKADVEFLKTNKDVILTGFQSDVRPWMLASDVFVFPSYREGFPNVVMQACCLKVPCIVSDINGSNEIITDQQSGLIVPVKNVTKLSHAMIELAENATKRKAFAERAYQFVVSNFDQQQIWQTLLKEYRALLAKHS
jgi:glycosyltransferase involved in cell wall biosynthesis